VSPIDLQRIRVEDDQVRCLARLERPFGRLLAVFEPMKIKDITVIETIKDGTTIYRKGS
jgi:hypothetical protein